MAPDLNSVPPSSRNPTASTSSQSQALAPLSRRASQTSSMGAPLLPLASPAGTIPASSQGSQPFPPLSPLATGSSAHPAGETGAGLPMRHPRPLTAAEMHSELEKEQEALVNRLTRELSALRAHSASVASTASTSSTAPSLFLDHSDPAHTAGPTHPTPSRRHRSSSSLSRGSVSAAVPSSYTSTASLPYQHRQSVSAVNPADSILVRASPSRSLSTPRYEETALHRQELEEVKRENELLRRRVRELEGELRQRRRSSASNGVRES